MRHYSKVAPTFWTGATGRAVRKRGQDATILAVYLITNPHANMYGLYYLPLPLIKHETGIPLEGALKGLRSLSEEEFCLYDPVTEWVFVIEMAKYQILSDGKPLKANDHRVKGINRDYRSLPDNPFLRHFYDRYKDDFHLSEPREPKPLRSPFEGASEPLDSPLHAPSKPHRSQEQEQEQEQDILVSYFSNADKSVRTLSASPGAEEPQNASELPTLSAPDGAACVRGLSLEDVTPSHEEAGSSRTALSSSSLLESDPSTGERSTCSDLPDDSSRLPAPAPGKVCHGPQFGEEQPPHQNAPSSSKLPDEIAIGRFSPSLPHSTTPQGSDASKTEFIDQSPPERLESFQEEDPAEASTSALPTTETADEPSAVDQGREFGSPYEGPGTGTKPEPPFYFTKRKRKLSGWKLDTFEEFWKAFSYKKGRAEAADAWLDIPGLTPELAARIIEAAKNEARERQVLIAKGQTPKWAQGWLSGRRWEDWEDDGSAHDQEIVRQEKNHAETGSQRSQTEESQYRQSIGEAVKRFL